MKCFLIFTHEKKTIKVKIEIFLGILLMQSTCKLFKSQKLLKYAQRFANYPTHLHSYIFYILEIAKTPTKNLKSKN